MTGRIVPAVPGVAPAPGSAAEILPPGAGLVRYAYRPRPFELARRLGSVPAGLTLAEIALVMEADPAVREMMVVTLGGDMIERRFWHRVRPRPGTYVAATILPRSGRAVLVAVLTVAIVVASVYTGGAAAGLAGGGGFGSLIGGLVSAGICVAGPLVLARGGTLPLPPMVPGKSA